MQPRQLNRSRIHSLLTEAEHSLAYGPHPERARRDAEAILLYILSRMAPERNRAWLLAHANDPTSRDARVEFEVLLKRRLAGEPIQYITGEVEFYGLPFYVTRDVLIPRPETEHVVEKAIELAAGFEQPRIADVGVGSGALAVALAHKLPSARITAIDCSRPALGIARGNAECNAVEDRIRFVEGDLLEPVAGEQFEIVVSNPPYVPESDRATLSIEVRDYEPAQALFAGADGLAIYRRLIPAAFTALMPGGFAVFEIGYGQQAAIHALLADAGYEAITFTPDLQGIPRVASGCRGCLALAPG
jgi:release factor glutamine methyltransferase